jgi:hypothetical protein
LPKIEVIKRYTRAFTRKPIINPPPTPLIAPMPELNIEKTGNPTMPKKIYKRIANVPSPPPRTKRESAIPRLCIVIGS